MIRTQHFHFGVATNTDAGRTGKINEDRLAVASFQGASGRPVLLAVVCDGIGGHLAGEVAAELAVQTIVERVAASDGIRPVEILESAIQAASQKIAMEAAAKTEQIGMGTTCAAAWLEGDRLYTAHVGDSRVYLLQGQCIHRTTVDHTWIQEAVEKGLITAAESLVNPNVHVLRRYLGGTQLPDVDTRLILHDGEDEDAARANQGTQMCRGDIVLVCTDGLTDGVADEEILRLVRDRGSLRSAAAALVAEANDRGGRDNITVVLASVPANRIL